MSEINVSPEQSKIVTHPVDQHAVVLAVAGSGKSTTLVERMVYLHDAFKVPSKNIIAVMFNKSAADEMADKLESRMGKRNAPLSLTYHRLGTLTLKLLTDRGLAPKWDFNPLVSAAIKFAVGVITPFCEVAGVKNAKFAATAFLGFVDRVKGDLADPYKVFSDGDWTENQSWFPLAYKAYEIERKEQGIRFFSDLIYDPVMIIREDPRAAKLVANRYDHVIVDEYQDICESQQALIAAVAGTRAKVMVVGDDDQTIYTWRGANPSYILRDFQRDFAGAIVYKLSRTWRYGHALSCAANYLIHNNKDRADKLCVSGSNANKTQVRLIQGDSESIIKCLRPLLAKEAVDSDGVVRYGDIAVLVRAYARSGTAQLEMLRYGIPFRLEGGEKVAVLENRWVKMLLGWMEVGLGMVGAQPYAGEPDFGSIAQMKEIINNWMELSWEAHGQLCRVVLKRPVKGEGFVYFNNHHLDSHQSRLKAEIKRFGDVWRSVLSMDRLRGVTPYQFFTKIQTDFNFDQRIKDAYQRPDDEEENKMLVKAFVDYAKQYNGNCLDFIHHIADLKSFSDAAKKSVEAVHITSIHRSKGLEWSYIFMVGLEQGKFPMKPKKGESGLDVARRLEDERRLFYVGMTRARKRLYLVAPLDNGVSADVEAAKDLSTDYVAPSTDGNLMLRLKGGSGVAPYSLMDWVSDEDEVGKADKESTSEGLPSQFLYEANLLFANILPLFMAGRVEALSSANPKLMNDYLKAVGSQLRVSHIQS